MNLPRWRGWLDACCPVSENSSPQEYEERGLWYYRSGLPRWVQRWYPRCYWTEGGYYKDIWHQHKWYCPGRIPTAYLIIRNYLVGRAPWRSE